MANSSSEMSGMPSNAGPETSLDHTDKQHTSFDIAGLPVHIFGLNGVTTKEVTVLFFLHGRLQRWEDLIGFIDQALQSVKGNGKSLLIVTFDQRNHGHRLVSQRANRAWVEDGEPVNPTHAADMHSIQYGTSSDVSLLIRYLEAYIFPNGHHDITQYLCAGISLGGHATWLVLSHEPQVQAGIAIIGCPDFLSLMRGRAEPLGGLTQDKMPDALSKAIRDLDPKVENMRGKRILILSGAKDKLVPFDKGAAFVEELKKVAGSVQVEVYPGVGHRCTETMIEELSRFVTREMQGSSKSSSL